MASGYTFEASKTEWRDGETAKDNRPKAAGDTHHKKEGGKRTTGGGARVRNPRSLTDARAAFFELRGRRKLSQGCHLKTWRVAQGAAQGGQPSKERGYEGERDSARGRRGRENRQTGNRH